jgi:V8-like Glu-specific endopeptidase
MTQTRSLATSLLTIPAAALLALLGAGTANAAPPASDEESKPSVASATVDSTGAVGYWTAERMRAAVPGDVLAGNALERRATPTKAVEKGKSTRVKASEASNPKFAVEADPVDHIGKVFFTMGGANYVCSGNAVASANESTVATAGHCLNQGPGAFATNFMFVPAYENGEEPYGRWTAKALYTTPQWQEKGDISYDTGFAVMNKLDGETLTDVVGGSGVAFNVDRGVDYTSYGYPASKPFSGEQLWSCAGTATDDPKNPAFKTQGIPCTMTGGSSGGPWLLDDGLQNSVNSYGYSNSGVMYGPYWGTVIENTYNIAQARR